ncbi:MAG: GFA family protein [Alphaproteobacteria bacterium]|nr:GFA family protein [Alphaproteobacteria bacterium]MBV8407557.1 GFA family protein [Alphaproteobacteria bacterium]
MEQTFEGGCLCGAVRYRVTGPVQASGTCHCRTCRKAASAPELPFATIAVKSFMIIQGRPVEFRSSEEATRSFCGRCGSPLSYRHDSTPETIDIMTCSLDDPDAVPPTHHIWASHKHRWTVIGDGLPVFATTRPA